MRLSTPDPPPFGRPIAHSAHADMATINKLPTPVDTGFRSDARVATPARPFTAVTTPTSGAVRRGRVSNRAFHRTSRLPPPMRRSAIPTTCIYKTCAPFGNDLAAARPRQARRSTPGDTPIDTDPQTRAPTAVGVGELQLHDWPPFRDEPAPRALPGPTPCTALSPASMHGRGWLVHVSR
jgi:hypothetical protein